MEKQPVAGVYDLVIFAVPGDDSLVIMGLSDAPPGMLTGCPANPARGNVQKQDTSQKPQYIVYFISETTIY